MPRRKYPGTPENFQPLIWRRWGIPTYIWRQSDVSWRTWAMEQAEKSGVRNLPHAFVTFQPYQQAGVMLGAANYHPTVDLVLQGMVAGGLIESRRPQWLAGVLTFPAIHDPGRVGLEVRISTCPP